MDLFEYNFQGVLACCGLTIGLFENRPVCVLSELMSNDGTSIMVALNVLIEQVRTCFNLDDGTEYYIHNHRTNDTPSIDAVHCMIRDDKVVLAEWSDVDPKREQRLLRYVTFFNVEGEYQEENERVQVRASHPVLPRDYG